MSRTRELSPVEIRVLGALLEKEQTTPDAYPLTLNALVAACNQKSNREPVMRLSEGEVGSTLESLRADALAWPAEGARVQRWQQGVDRRWSLDAPAKAVMTLLLLRGPQTPGELRSRSERLHAFPSLEALEGVLARLAQGAGALVEELPRRPGQRESRWRHRVGEEGESPPAAEERLAPTFFARKAFALEPSTLEPSTLEPSTPEPVGAEPSIRDQAALRIDRLERAVEELQRELADLRQRLGE